MSLAELGRRLVRNAVHLVRLARGGRILHRAQPPVKLLAKGGAGPEGGRSALFHNPFAKFVPADLRKRLTDRLFHGNSVPLYSFIGVSLATGGLLTKDDEQDIQCWNIREAVSKFPYGLYYYQNDLIKSVRLEDLSIGEPIAKGSCAVVYSAKLKDSNDSDESLPEAQSDNLNAMQVQNVDYAIQNDPEHPLALKIMFNYDIQSNAAAIFNAMYHEMVPARNTKIDGEILRWCSFHNEIAHLPPHPNIVAMYSAFTDFMPNLINSMDIFPDALPVSHNPNGLGRNKTLFLLMKRYKYSLYEYLKNQQIETNDSLFLLAQLLEAIAHMNRHGIAHRDLKSDNILVEKLDLDGDNSAPILVVSDFGCCLADKRCGLKLPYTSSYISKGGNINLMAPEILLQQPGMFSFLDYQKADLWAAGTIAYEIFGYDNPFSPNSMNGDQDYLSNYNYTDDQLPEIIAAPLIVQKLVKNILSRNPKKRLHPEVAANVCQLYRWAPNSWITSKKLPTNDEILKWVMHLAIKLVCGGQLLNQIPDITNPEYNLITSFLLRVRFSYIKDALYWIQDNN